MAAKPSLRIESNHLQSVDLKTYVLDTNVLLHDPNALMAFNEHRVVTR
jgi:PhoH-like ATPase